MPRVHTISGPPVRGCSGCGHTPYQAPIVPAWAPQVLRGPFGVTLREASPWLLGAATLGILGIVLWRATRR